MDTPGLSVARDNSKGLNLVYEQKIPHRAVLHTIPYGHFVTHHYFVIFNYRSQIYTTHLATSLNTFNIFPYPIPSETKQFHKEMIEIVFST
jgi:hypothetical protein